MSFAIDTPSLVIVELPLLVQDDVAALGSERDSNGIGQLVHARSSAGGSSSNEISFATVIS